MDPFGKVEFGIKSVPKWFPIFAGYTLKKFLSFRMRFPFGQNTKYAEKIVHVQVILLNKGFESFKGQGPFSQGVIKGVMDGRILKCSAISIPSTIWLNGRQSLVFKLGVKWSNDDVIQVSRSTISKCFWNCFGNFGDGYWLLEQMVQVKPDWGVFILILNFIEIWHEID